MYAGVSALSFTGVTGTAVIPLTGTVGIYTGVNNPYDIISLVTSYELAEASPNDPGTPGTDNADLKYVGVTNDNRVAAGGFVTNTTVYFGISTWGNHDRASAEVEFDIYIDSRTGMATWDYVVWNTNTGTSSFTQPMSSQPSCTT